ncbi:hypothetical protein D3C87_324160 [compost metagenome]
MNHQAIVARVTEVQEIPNATNVHVAVVLGEFCVTSKDVQKGDVGILFPEGLQLSEEYVFENNLSRKVDNNKDKNKTGFFEENRRVRAQPFLKVRSTALFMPMESIAYAGDWNEIFNSLSVGTQFDTYGGHSICQKYMNEKTRKAASQGGAKAQKKNLTPDFLEHVETSQFKHVASQIPTGSLIYFHAKKHGTSGRTAHTQVFLELPWWKKMINKVVHVFPEWGYDFATGTRRVVLRSPSATGFHGSEAFRHEITMQLAPFLSKGMTAYYEIVGFVNGSSIMPEHSVAALKDKAYTKKYGDTITYKYGCQQGQYKFHIYRLTVQGVDGEIRDLSQAALEKWCSERELPCTLEVHPKMIYTGDELALRSLVEGLTERPEVLTEDYEDAGHISEGIILRIETGKDVPMFVKSKSYAFRVLEGIASVTEVDLEDAS